MSENYVTIKEGMFNGVSYRIRDAKFVEEDGGHLIKFDYDAKGLDDSKAPEFEQMLGNLILSALDDIIKEDKEE